MRKFRRGGRAATAVAGSAVLLLATACGEKGDDPGADGDVELVIPEDSDARPIRAGDTIGQDRSTVGIELQQLMDDLMPLLRAVEPGELNATLSAFATALEGRGEEIGENLVKVEEYLRELNPHMPTIQTNISRFADVTEIYDDAAPDLLRVLENSITSSQTLVDRQADLEAFLTRTATAASTTEEFLNENGDRFITLGEISRPTLALFDRYAPQYPCMFEGLVEQDKRSEKAFRNGKMHITLEFVQPRTGYTPGEEPRYADRSGPNCQGLPNPPVPAPYHKLDDGTKERRAQLLTAPGGADFVSATEGEQRLIGPLVAPVLGVSAEEVPAVTTLLFGPMARGTKVSVT
jgi:phospholipid/cholesterol/gamma-HCH transport system substrate-binding protein